MGRALRVLVVDDDVDLSGDPSGSARAPALPRHVGHQRARGPGADGSGATGRGVSRSHHAGSRWTHDPRGDATQQPAHRAGGVDERDLGRACASDWCGGDPGQALRVEDHPEADEATCTAGGQSSSRAQPGFSGSCRTKMHPCPGTLVTSMVPPWASAAFLAMARPRPKPLRSLPP